jgi:hypothetical protein
MLYGISYGNFRYSLNVSSSINDEIHNQHKALGFRLVVAPATRLTEGGD